MNSRKITDADIAELKISSLPTRPTAPAEFGGRGFSASELKSAFDALPLYIIERYNELIEDIESGAVAQALTVDGYTLADYLRQLRADLDALTE